MAVEFLKKTVGPIGLKRLNPSTRCPQRVTLDRKTRIMIRNYRDRIQHPLSYGFTALKPSCSLNDRDRGRFREARSEISKKDMFLRIFIDVTEYNLHIDSRKAS